MRFLVDECTGPKVSQWLRKQDHEVFSVYEQARGLVDEDVIKMAYIDNWILITNDKGFGEKIFREGHPHRGVVFLRLEDERTVTKIRTINKLLELYSDKLSDNFVVATETKVRFARK